VVVGSTSILKIMSLRLASDRADDPHRSDRIPLKDHDYVNPVVTDLIANPADQL